MLKQLKKATLASAVIVTSIAFSSTSLAGNANGHDKVLFNPNTPSLTVVNSISDVQGYVGAFGAENIIYPIAGDVYATVTDDDTGVTQGGYVKEGTVSATVLLDYGFFGLLGPWNQIPASTIPWTMSDDFAMVINGTTFTFEEKLDGRAFPDLGPVEAINPDNPIESQAVRMSGCAGVRADNEGDYAGKVGTLCLNGTFTFDANFNGHGVSNCSIALHTPQPGFPTVRD